MTLANRITFVRFGLVLIYLVLLHLATRSPDPTLLDIGLVLLVLAGFLDVLDGAVARRLGETTELGRVLDPLVDKIFICGSFVFFASMEDLDGIVEPWVPVVFLIREFGVHAIRVDLESRGIPFGASHWGKWKTFSQTFAAGGCLLYAAHLKVLPWREELRLLLLVLVGLAVASTVLSGILYLLGAAGAWRRLGK